jgi:hypothetical protein
VSQLSVHRKSVGEEANPHSHARTRSLTSHRHGSPSSQPAPLWHTPDRCASHLPTPGAASPPLCLPYGYAVPIKFSAQTPPARGLPTSLVPIRTGKGIATLRSSDAAMHLHGHPRSFAGVSLQPFSNGPGPGSRQGCPVPVLRYCTWAGNRDVGTHQPTCQLTNTESGPTTFLPLIPLLLTTISLWRMMSTHKNGGSLEAHALCSAHVCTRSYCVRIPDYRTPTHSVPTNWVKRASLSTASTT